MPSYSKELKLKYPTFNARAEGLASKATWRGPLKSQRAIIPATGYYEWKTVDDVKTPHFIHLPEGELFVFAGLYEWWRDPAEADDSPNKWLLSTSVLTREATGALAGIHDRMPVFLSPELLDEWLDPHTEGEEDLLAEISHGGEEMAERVEFHVVDRAVGNVRNNSPELMQPIGTEPPA